MLVKNNITSEVTEGEDIAVEPIELTPEQKEQMYKNLVVSYIRVKYTADDENAILRKKLAGIDNGEFDTFNAYAESCKARARSEIYV
jgi:hypothetical protein